MDARLRALQHVFGETEPPGTIFSPNDDELAENWPGGGVLIFPPHEGRTGWHYVTHGLSQPFDDLPDATVADNEDEPPISGWGIELVMSTRNEAHWPAHVLLGLVRYLLFDESSRVILPDHRIPVNGPLVSGSDTELRHLLAVQSPEYPSLLRLPAGYCRLVHLVGATDGEIARAKEWGSGEGGSQILAAVYEEMGVGCLSDPARRSLTRHPRFEATWNRVERELEAAWRENGWTGDGKRRY